MNKSILEHVGAKIRTQGMSKRVKNISVSAIKEMMMVAAQYENALSFAWGVPSFKADNYIHQNICQAIMDSDTIDKYAPMPGIPELKQALAETSQVDFVGNLVLAKH